MDAVSGVFVELSRATEAAKRLRAILSDDRVHLLQPGQADAARQVPVTEDMPGVGPPMLGIIAGAVGTGIGLMVPGIGQITAASLAAAALLGAGGGVAGWKAGEAMDRALSDGLPIDELYVYEDALRKGRAVVIAVPRTPEERDQAERAVTEAGAETLDQARGEWWLGLRDAERGAYEPSPTAYDRDEALFRQGFEAALSPRTRGQRFEEARPWLAQRCPDAVGHDAFRNGYTRGQRYVAACRERDTTSSETRR